MFKLFTAQQIAAWDRFTIEKQGISAIDLMERAAEACVQWIEAYARENELNSIAIFCGPGNNGGDGLAIARILSGKGFKIDVYLCSGAEKVSECNKINLSCLEDIPKVSVHQIGSEKDLPDEINADLYIDALLGIGLNRAPEGFFTSLIKQINISNIPVVSIDIPSGLFADTISEHTEIIRALYTLTFQQLKLSFLFPESENYTGIPQVLNIGLDPEFTANEKSPNYLLNQQSISSIIKPRKSFSHKGNYGHALLVAGSKGKIGTAILATKAALRSGAGLVSAVVPGYAESILHVSVPEAMVLSSSEDHIVQFTSFIPEKCNAIGIGPGIGIHEETTSALKLLIQQWKGPLVLDADAINILAENRTWLAFLPKNSILTPHIGEFDRLAGKSSNSSDRHLLQKELSVKYGVYIILKGAYSCISSPEGICYFNSTGNPGMATGGSGDVLTGTLTGLLAQGYNSLQSCLVGTYLHGLAGDIAAQSISEEALIASDILQNLGNAYLRIKE